MSINLRETFEKYEDEYLKFDRVQVQMSGRPDLHAFLLLDQIQPGKRDVVSAAEHDEIWLDIDCEALAEQITEEQVCELVRCGVRYDDGPESLALFV